MLGGGSDRPVAGRCGAVRGAWAAPRLRQRVSSAGAPALRPWVPGAASGTVRRSSVGSTLPRYAVFVNSHVHCVVVLFFFKKKNFVCFGLKQLDRT